MSVTVRMALQTFPELLSQVLLLMVQDSAKGPGASAGMTKLRHKLSEDLRALQELLDT